MARPPRSGYRPDRVKQRGHARALVRTYRTYCGRGSGCILKSVRGHPGRCSIATRAGGVGNFWSQSFSRQAALRIGGGMGWSDMQTAAELETVEVGPTSLLRKPQGVNASVEA